MGDGDECFLGDKHHGLAPRCVKHTEYKSQPSWEQMECDFFSQSNRKKWDNSPQLIHCTLKTHYSWRRNGKSLVPKTERNTQLKVKTLAETSFFSCVKFLITQTLLTRCLCWRGALCEFAGGHSFSGHPPAVKHVFTHTCKYRISSQLLYLTQNKHRAHSHRPLQP